MNTNPDLMTLQELAEYLKLAERTVYGYAQKGVLPGIKIGSSWRFRKSDIDAWLEQQFERTASSRPGSANPNPPEPDK